MRKQITYYVTSPKLPLLFLLLVVKQATLIFYATGCNLPVIECISMSAFSVALLYLSVKLSKLPRLKASRLSTKLFAADVLHTILCLMIILYCTLLCGKINDAVFHTLFAVLAFLEGKLLLHLVTGVDK